MVSFEPEILPDCPITVCNFNNINVDETQIYTPLEGNRSNLAQTALGVSGLIHAGQVSFIINYDYFLNFTHLINYLTFDN